MLAAIPQIDPNTALDAFGSIVGPGHDPKLLLVAFVTVLARVLGFMIVAPFFGSMNIPMTARVGFAVILTAVTLPYAEPVVTLSLGKELAGGGALDTVLLLANQVLVGLMLGFTASFLFYAIESAGRVIDTQRGSNMTDIIAPQSGERTSPTGQFLMMVALMVLVVSGLHMVMIEGLIQSFEVFPPTLGLEWLGDPLKAGPGNPELEGAIATFAQLSGDSLLLTLQIAAPAMITLLLTDVLLGIINRGAPQVNVFALSQVVKGPIGIAALMISLLATWNYLDDHALQRMCIPETTLSADDAGNGRNYCENEGDNSIVRLAEKMHQSDLEATRLERQRNFAPAGEVS